MRNPLTSVLNLPAPFADGFLNNIVFEIFVNKFKGLYATI